ncbi:hypothetical protein ACQKWADRAFT_316620 [Trichoderma austrokoningii]
MDEQGPNISVSQLDSAMTVLLQHLPQEFRDQLENFWISLRLCLHSEYEAIRCERQALELVRQSMTNSECEHEITQRAIEELLSNIISAQEPSTIPRPRTPNSVLNTHVRIMQEFRSSDNSVTGARLRTKGDLISLIANIVPNDEVEKLKTIPPQWMRDHLESIRDVSQDNDTGCWLSSTSTMVNPYQAQLDLGHHTSGQVWDDFKVHRKRLAIAAKGEASLLVAVPLVYQISNLCHNNSCFRPEHMEIESDDGSESIFFNALDQAYPSWMPFYLYGSNDEAHRDHVLKKASNGMIIADSVKLAF